MPDFFAAQDFDQGAGELVHHLGRVARAGREAQALGAARDGRKIDRLNVEPVFGEQDVADALGLDRAADQQRYDMRHARHQRQAGGGELALEDRGGGLLRLARFARALEVADAGKGAGDEYRRQRGREDEARRIAADAIDDRLVGRDIAAHHAERLAQSAFDDGQPVGDPVTLGDAAAALAVHADRMDFVEVGQSVVAVGKIADGGDRGDVAVHRIDALEGDQLGRVGIFGREQLFEMLEVVVPEHALLASRALDPRDHRGVVQFVGEDHAVGKQFADRRQRRLVRHVARGEQQRRLLAVELGQLGLELGVVMGVAADVAGSARSGANVVKRLLHRLDHDRVLAHSEIIVGAPDGDWLGAVAAEAARVGILAAGAQDIDEHAVAAFVVKALDRRLENAIVVQAQSSLRAPSNSHSGRRPLRTTRNYPARKVRTSPIPNRSSDAFEGCATSEVKTIRPSEGWAGQGWPRVKCAIRRAIPGPPST